MRKLIILKGLPGSGKSTLTSKLVTENDHTICINRDSIRAMFAGVKNDPYALSSSKKQFVLNSRTMLVGSALRAGFDVIVDDTNLQPRPLADLHSLAKNMGNVTVEEVPLNVPIDECIARDSLREWPKKVGAKVILSMAKSSKILDGRQLLGSTTVYPAHVSIARAPSSPAAKKAIMCDLDGTLAIINGRSPYDATDCDVKDKPNVAVIECVLSMYNAGYDIVFMSGRDDRYRPETIRFIEKHCGFMVEASFPDKGHRWEPIKYELFMRGQTNSEPDKHDQRSDNVVKGELYDRFVKDKYDVLFVLDDRSQVVRLWRDIGLTTFQVNDGDF